MLLIYGRKCFILLIYQIIPIFNKLFPNIPILIFLIYFQYQTHIPIWSNNLIILTLIVINRWYFIDRNMEELFNLRNWDWLLWYHYNQRLLIIEMMLLYMLLLWGLRQWYNIILLSMQINGRNRQSQSFDRVK